PSLAELAWARRVLAAAEDAEKNGRGAFLLDGKMIDKPFIAAARRILHV
ncbi:MAG: hypothetical protein RLZZ502_1770, partial [Pseudomonadota bacterium]